jgi:hypothetical protein
MYEPSLKMMHSLLTSEARNTRSLPVTVLIAGSLSQVDATIELTNQICDKYLRVNHCEAAPARFSCC